MNLMFELTSATWWRAASARALRTAISVLIPLIASTTILGVDWALVGSAFALAIIGSYVTSLAGLKELTTEGVSRLRAIVVRVVKQFAQTLVGFIGASALLHEVDWSNALLIAATSAVVTLLQGVLTALPEEEVVLTNDTQ